MYTIFSFRQGYKIARWKSDKEKDMCTLATHFPTNYLWMPKENIIFQLRNEADTTLTKCPKTMWPLNTPTSCTLYIVQRKLQHDCSCPHVQNESQGNIRKPKKKTSETLWKVCLYSWLMPRSRINKDWDNFPCLKKKKNEKELGGGVTCL